ncbi:MAG: hypothetical protein LUE06_02520 [Oscillospiraceae bacterium]|nr:hypothetical protein [Oscillospiraceae bacterium]MCD8099442.1 hypothetical protein [Oscillospiraceae bacterium]MCD8192062.1 hypothetical protein [Oscillospiraceae bacterium]
MKKLNIFLNILIGAFVGVFVGHGIYVCWDFKTHPDLYAAWSAPWYTSILAYGAAALAVVVVAVVAKIVIKKYGSEH